jgi:hypothetical protein
LTQFDAHEREIPISAATWAIRRLLQRSISRRRPSTDSGALRCVTDPRQRPHCTCRCRRVRWWLLNANIFAQVLAGQLGKVDESTSVVGVGDLCIEVADER